MSKSKTTFSSYSLSKGLISIHILAIQLLMRSVSSLNLTNEYLHHKCLGREGNYKPGSEYEKDLNALTKQVYVQKILINTGFLAMGMGDPPSVYMVVQCRGDSYGIKCRDCFATALAGLRRRCPGNKAAIIWYEQCYLTISTVEIPMQRMDYENTFSMHNPNNVRGDKELFNKQTADFLNEVTLKAIKRNGIKLVNYAAGEKMLGAKRLYAMTQCGLNAVHCKACLQLGIRELSKCCYGKQGARVYFGRSCNVRYELYPFLRTEKEMSV